MFQNACTLLVANQSSDAIYMNVDLSAKTYSYPAQGSSEKVLPEVQCYINVNTPMAGGMYNYRQIDWVPSRKSINI